MSVLYLKPGILRTLVVASVASQFSAAEPVFMEKGGLVVMEAESTSSRLGDWEKKTDVEGYQGECHLEFTGNSTISGPPESPLKYSFTISREGTYSLTLRARKRLESARQDISNDCYVALKGDFEAGGEAPLAILKKDTKMFGGNANGWGWADQLDADHKKFRPEYRLKKGETYELTISGRSKNFNIDQIIFYHESQARAEVQSKKLPESGTSGADISSTPEIIRRKLTNREGRVIDTQLVRKDGDSVVVLIGRKEHRIKIASLSDEDQEFFKTWGEEDGD